MKLMLTSFELDQEFQAPYTTLIQSQISSLSYGPTEVSDLNDLGTHGTAIARTIFHRMPPVDMRSTDNYFMPDYAALLLCEEVTLDEASFMLLTEQPHRLYAKVAETMKALRAEGFIQLVDFSHILRENQALLQRMLENDLGMLNQWIKPLNQSFDIWRRLSSKLIGQELTFASGHHEFHHMHPDNRMGLSNCSCR
jgi:hypothetical protein